MKRLFIILIIFFSHNSQAYDKLAEITLGNVWAVDEQFAEMGLDLEYFPERYSHFFSFGLASEIEFEKDKEFYTGPLVSYYHSQKKIYITAGLQGHDSYWRLKSRVGAGYDFHLSHAYMIIPNITVDFIDSETHPGLSVGVARKF